MEDRERLDKEDRERTSSAPRACSSEVGVDVGVDVTVEELRAEFDAVCIATGAGAARDLNVPGRELEGIHLV